MMNKNNFKKKAVLLLFSSVLSCSTYAMESLNFKSEIKSSDETSSKDKKSNIKKLFEDIAKEKKLKKSMRTIHFIIMKLI